ncbi:phosphonate C-P lyase system protein PhnH [Magnetovibrio blakemorei]|uniref:Phosphonate C-P lyase system protein PhnH n=1 Tax=Magnetovibrio blakemorei TaxID=28181 RepID=A0A1E5Q515_9PROT|nr:phosphonate C-P lyase system protein PhnH [Magnetovibrio blakemorei]OEJ65155.1 phosphonate C-P lyase system protein PhnH [Magnetovibrio blakemorei]
MLMNSQDVRPLPGQPLPGFAVPVHDSQRVFRGILDAMAHPGKIVELTDLPDAPKALNKASVAVCLALVDFETPLWADDAISAQAQAVTHIQFHCGCPITTAPEKARFALLSQGTDLTSLKAFCHGTDERPDLSTTVIVQAEGFGGGEDVRLSGPGIKTETTLSITGVGTGFWQAVRDNAQRFPRGVDLMICTDEAIVCLPRTIEVED